MNRIIRMAIILIAMGLIALVLLPRWAPVQAVSWTPPPNAGLIDAFAPNQALSALTEMPVGFAPEHVACDANGKLYTSLDGGAVLKSNEAGTWTTIGNTGGRPLGLRTDQQGGLWIADSMAGLVHMDSTGQISVLAT